MFAEKSVIFHFLVEGLLVDSKIFKTLSLLLSPTEFPSFTNFWENSSGNHRPSGKKVKI